MLKINVFKFNHNNQHILHQNLLRHKKLKIQDQHLGMVCKNKNFAQNFC